MTTKTQNPVSQVIVKQTNLIAKTFQLLQIQGKMLAGMVESNQKLLEAYELHTHELEAIKASLTSNEDDPAS